MHRVQTTPPFVIPLNRGNTSEKDYVFIDRYFPIKIGPIVLVAKFQPITRYDVCERKQNESTNLISIHKTKNSWLRLKSDHFVKTRVRDGKLFAVPRKCIKGPTRITEMCSSLLDIALVSCPDLILHSEILDAGISDHCPIRISLRVPCPTHQAYKRTIWNYTAIHPPDIAAFFKEVNWNDFFDQIPDPNSLGEAISSILVDGIYKFVPHKEVTIRVRDPEWMNGYIRRILRKRNRIHRQAKLFDSPNSWSEFRKFRNFVTSEIRRVKLEYHTKINECKFNEKD
ncbi:hypothetical protein LOTGIDRAFT_163388 [Lottia gigantea]|uniref:Endonuclease/exonuclease/phosphatase domain-containing protein n=1 Tax=Lottia gigantea TaxID=225164 RepID=V4BRW1_LOTGI|nr:hypothetical protein LOTGIDRAFT_163388 [Lottia gigantea]ESO91659.1 hypothetical protein LOTGIDRAFT_163388 [Lottia gigantea]